MYVQAGRGGAGDRTRVSESIDWSRNSKKPSTDDASSCWCGEQCSSPVGEELVQQQLSLGRKVLLGAEIFELTIRVPMKLSLPRDACLQDTRQVVTDKHEMSQKCNWLCTSSVFQVRKHGLWSRCNTEV